MCGGGGGAKTQKVEQTTTNLPDYAEPYFRDLMNRSAFQSSLPYEPYGGQRLAYYSPMEQEAMARYGELGVSGTPQELRQATGLAYKAASPVSSSYQPGRAPTGFSMPSERSSYQAGSRESGYTAGQMGPGGEYRGNIRDVGFLPGSLADKDALKAYEDPYWQQVVDITKREAMRDADIRRRNIGLDASTSGNLGSYREGLERAENERNLGQLLGDIQTKGAQAAFQSSQQAFLADRAAQAQLETFRQQQLQLNEQVKQRMTELVQQGFSAEEAARQAQEQFGQAQFSLNEQARQAQSQIQQGYFSINSQNAQVQNQLRLQAYQAQQQAEQEAARLGLNAAQIQQAGQLAASNALANYAQQQQNMELDRLGMMYQVGQADRNMMQQSLDMGYQDWLRQQAYPMEQLGFYSQMLHGLPVEPGRTSTIYGQQPSTTQQLLGSGIAAAGLYNAFGGRG